MAKEIIVQNALKEMFGVDATIEQVKQLEKIISQKNGIPYFSNINDLESFWKNADKPKNNDK